MKVFEKSYKTNNDLGLATGLNFDTSNMCVFDIETTGLHYDRSKVILTAMLMPSEFGYTITQYLAENHYEENKVIDATLKFFEDNKIEYLVTFNGGGFDIPFFNQRCNNLHLEKSIHMYNYDIFRFLRKETDLKTRLTSMSQASIERFLGIRNVRKDTISGKESVQLYNRYVLDGNRIHEALILTHNREDVQQLYSIMQAIHSDAFASNLIDDSLDKALASFGFPLSGRFSVHSHINKGKLEYRIIGSQYSMPFDAAVYPNGDSPLRASFNKKTATYEIILPLNEYEDSLFLDTKALGISEQLQGHNNYINGYYIVSENGQDDYNAVNIFSQTLLIYLVNILEPFSDTPYRVNR